MKFEGIFKSLNELKKVINEKSPSCNDNIIKLSKKYLINPMLGIKSKYSDLEYNPSISGFFTFPDYLTTECIYKAKKMISTYPENKYNKEERFEIQAKYIFATTMNYHKWLEHFYREYGVEHVFPYIDIDLIEYLLKVPPSIRETLTSSKLLQRKAFKDVLPSSIINRKGHGDFSSWTYSGINKEWIQINKALDIVCENFGRYIDKDSATNLLLRCKMGEGVLTSQLWKLLSFCIWFYNQKNFKEDTFIEMIKEVVFCSNNS